MIKKIWVIFIWLVLIAGVVKAQPQRSVILSAWTDNLTSRGSNFQYTTNLRHDNRTGQQGKVFTRSMQFGCRLGFYHRTANHNGYLGMPFLRWQRQRPKGLIIDWEIGLGYLTLGQASNTLSGGEAQRIKLANELSKPSRSGTLYVLDEPTTGLHFQDIEKLVKVLHSLVDRGNTLIVIEHNLDIMKESDYIVDLGPEGGMKGGQLIAACTPEQLVKKKKSLTGHFLSHSI